MHINWAWKIRWVCLIVLSCLVVVFLLLSFRFVWHLAAAQSFIRVFCAITLRLGFPICFHTELSTKQAIIKQALAP